MKTKNSFIIVLAGFVVASIAGVSTYYTLLGDSQTNPNNEKPSTTQHGGVEIMSSYASHDVAELKKTAKTIIKGKIIDKYQIIQNRDEFGTLVNENSPSSVVREPYVIYEVQIEKPLKGDQYIGNTIKLKVLGGTLDGLTVNAGFDEYVIGDTIIVLADGLFDDKFYQPIAGPHSIFKIENDKAIGAEKSMSEASLIQKLQ